MKRSDTDHFSAPASGQSPACAESPTETGRSAADRPIEMRPSSAGMHGEAEPAASDFRTDPECLSAVPQPEAACATAPPPEAEPAAAIPPVEAGQPSADERATGETTVTQLTPDDVIAAGGPITPANDDGSPTRRQIEQDVVAVNPSLDSMESRG